MSAPTHALVWVDHREAKVFRFTANEQTKILIHARLEIEPAQHQVRAGVVHPDDIDFYSRTVATLDQAAGILLTGPGQSKWALHAYIRDLHPDLAPHVYDLDAQTRPADHNLVALARGFFELRA